MRDATTVILSIILGFLLCLLRQTKGRNVQEMPDGYEVIMCKKIEQKGDTIITINKLLPTHEETND